MKYLLIFLGGGMGSIFRYLLALFVNERIKLTTSVHFLGTLIVNLLGCILIGLSFVLIKKYNLNEYYNQFLVVGLCGGFTTFSTFNMENYKLLQNNEFGLAFLNISVSILMGLILIKLMSISCDT